jgi:hypothetical protein
MKIKGYEFPHSSFLSLEKDCGIIVRDMLNNNNLKKLLFYEDKNCLSLPDLTAEQTASLIDKQIMICPKVEIDKEMFSYILVTFDDFIPNANNPEYRDNTITFYIVCHFDSWNLGDFQLRPYKIAGELDSMFNEKNVFGIGKLKFTGSEQFTINDEFGGIILVYASIHGNEDKVD